MINDQQQKIDTQEIEIQKLVTKVDSLQRKIRRVEQCHQEYNLNFENCFLD